MKEILTGSYSGIPSCKLHRKHGTQPREHHSNASGTHLAIVRNPGHASRESRVLALLSSSCATRQGRSSAALLARRNHGGSDLTLGIA